MWDLEWDIYLDMCMTTKYTVYSINTKENKSNWYLKDIEPM